MKLFVYTLMLSLLSQITLASTTKIDGVWTNPAIWNEGVPPSQTVSLTTHYIQHNLTVDGNLDLLAGGNLVIGDESGAPNTLSVSGSVNSALFSNIIIRSDGVLIINSNALNSLYGSIQVDGELIIKGDFVNLGTSGITITEGGKITVEGNLTNDGTINNNGTLDVSGEITGSGTIEGNSPLPIELLSFDAKQTTDGITLIWVTATEENNHYFEIQRSADALTFENLATISGAGKSKQELTYTFTDTNPHEGTVYYRLMQVDYNGMFEIFDPVAINYTNKEIFANDPEISLYPNPFTTGELTLELKNWNSNSSTTILLIDVSGTVVFNQVFNSLNENHIKLNESNLGKLPKGYYFLVAKNKSTSLSKPLIIQ
ncbi:MAG: T9SS type A sorting domain-containing protein [Salinivirgaceae bacterium]